MARLLAICPVCGLVPSSFEVRNSTDLTFTNCADQCPKCGNETRIPDGVYSVLEETVSVLLASRRTTAELKELLATLKTVKTTEEAREVIQKTAPEIAPVADKLPNAGDGFHRWIGSVSALLMLALGIMQYQGGKENLTNKQFNEGLDRFAAKITEQCRASQQPAPRNRHERRAAKRHK